MSIIIYTNAIHSGKTQSLFAWCQKQANVGGILMPNLSGKKQFYDIATQTYFDAQVDEFCNDEIWQIGKYCFSKQAFDNANKAIIKAMAENKDWVIIDEIGYLELEQKGLYDSWQFCLQFINNQQFKKHLVLVVRSNLLKKVVQNLQDLPCELVKDWQIM